MCARRSARHRRRSIPTSRWSPTTRRCRSSRQAQTWYIKDMLKDTEHKDLPVLSAAAPFKSGGRGGAGLLHRRAGGRRGDQERRRPLPLSEHRAGGGDHRRAGQGMAGDVGRHLQHDREGQGRPAADQPRLPVLQFRRDRRRHLQDRSVAAAEICAEGRGAEREFEPHRRPDRSRASRSTRRRNSSSRPTIIAPAAAAISPRSMRRR